MKTLDPGIYQDAHGISVKPRRGSGAHALKIKSKRYPLGTPLSEMQAYRDQAVKKAEERQPKISRGTFSAEIREHLLSAHLTKVTKKRRTQQLHWWEVQPAALHAKVYSPAEVKAEDEAIEQGLRKPRTRTLGELHRSAFDLRRLTEILDVAFKATDEMTDPTEFANTSNHYRTALLYLYTERDQFETDTFNPITKINVRPRALAQSSGVDARLIAETLKHVRAKCGFPGVLSELRLNVLAWVHITPTQLMGVHPPTDFHDMPDATREDILDGAITLTKRPRLKGRKNRPLPPPETIPLNPWGVAAMRAYAACREAWEHPERKGKFSMSPVNRIVKRAAARAEAALKARGIDNVDGALIDLSAFTLRHLKHSLGTTAQIASGGLVDREGHLKINPGVQRSMDHGSDRTTRIYTQAAVDPVIRYVNRVTTLFLEDLFSRPLRPSTMRLVEKK